MPTNANDRSVSGALGTVVCLLWCLLLSVSSVVNARGTEACPDKQTVEPGNYKSDIFKSLLQRMADNEKIAADSPFAEQFKRISEGSADRSQFKDPDEVSAAVMHALFADDPKLRYMVVPNEFEAKITITQAMREMVQLNAGQTYTYDREALIAILDGVLAELEE